MPLVQIDMLKGKDPAFKKDLLDMVHQGLVETLGIEDWDRFQRINEFPGDEFEKPDGKSDDFMIIRLTIFPGRKAAAKRDAIERITSLISSKLGVAPSDIFIVIDEPPLSSWGMAGNQKGGDTECLITGLHHYSMKCDQKERFDEAVTFYTEILGLKIGKMWKDGVLIDLPNARIEIFCNGKGIDQTGAVRHIALSCSDVDLMAEKVTKAGYSVVVGPKDISFETVPVSHARMAFCIGPLGEQIEFFCER